MCVWASWQKLPGFVPNPWEPGQTDFELELVVDVGLATGLHVERERERETFSFIITLSKSKISETEAQTCPSTNTPESPITDGGPIGRGALLAPYTLGKKEKT